MCLKKVTNVDDPASISWELVFKEPRIITTSTLKSYAYVYHIVAKTIAVSDEVYRKLKKARMPGESFSSAIKRNLDTRPKLSELIGDQILSPEDWAKTRKALNKAERKTSNKLFGSK